MAADHVRPCTTTGRPQCGVDVSSVSSASEDDGADEGADDGAITLTTGRSSSSPSSSFRGDGLSCDWWSGDGGWATEKEASSKLVKAETDERRGPDDPWLKK